MAPDPGSAVIGRGLHQKQVVTLEHPLHVLGAPVVLLHAGSQAGQRDRVVVRQHSPSSFGGAELDAEIGSIWSASNGERLLTHPYRDQSRTVLVHHVGVGFDRPADHDLAEAERGLDDHPGGITGRRVSREHDPRTVGVEHGLDHDRDRRLVPHPSGGPVRKDPLAEQRRPAVHNSGQKILGRHVRERAVHARKGRVAGVLRGRRRPHRDPGR